MLALRDVESITLSAEHGIIRLRQPDATIRAGDGMNLLIGYLDATTCLHDHLYGVRAGRVESVWEILGRGKLA
jgi:D-serine deaminase-like pyridoxal phosphate-dependent protein